MVCVNHELEEWEGPVCNLMSDVEGREKVERTQVDCQCAHARSCPVNSTCVLVGAWSGSYFSEVILWVSLPGKETSCHGFQMNGVCV